MKRARLLVIVLLTVSGPAWAGGKALPKAITADNGLAASAAMRAGGYLTRVILHFAGLDPPLDWVPPPKSAELFPAWVDEPVAKPAALVSLSVPACGKADLTQLAVTLQKEQPAPARPVSSGLIHIEAPASAADEGGLDSRAIYGHSSDDCVLSARE